MMLGLGFHNLFVSQYDVDAQLFIDNHNAVTGFPMSIRQELAINGLVSRLKGKFTSNGSNLWDSMKIKGTRLFPLCPSSDLIAYKSGYQMELLSASSLGTYNGFLASDILPIGARGGVGKYFDTGVSGSFYSQNSYQHGVYVIENLGGAGLIGGSNVIPVRNYILFSGGNVVYYANAQYGSNTGFMYLGNLLFQRIAFNKDELIVNGVSVYSSSNTSNGTIIANILVHGVTSSGSVNDPRMSFYSIGCPVHDVFEKVDFNDSIQWYQSNVIPNGRGV